MAGIRLQVRQNDTLSNHRGGVAPLPNPPGAFKARLKAKRDAAVAARAAEAQRKVEKLAARAFRAEGLIPIPPWVPRHLRDTYRNVSWNRSEQEAAAVIRAMKGSLRP